MNNLSSGMTLILLSAICGGAFAVPLKKRRRYEWENTWLLGFLFALVIIPLIAVTIFLPVWLAAIKAAGLANDLLAMAFGFLWGWGAVTFAMAINAVGLSLGYAIIMGINTAVGSIIPMIRRWGEVPGDARTVTLAGIVVCTLGVAICGRAGVLREGQDSKPGGDTGSAVPQNLGMNVFLIGVAWCILSGLLSACANLGFDFADRVALEAQRLGAHPAAASIGRWITVYWGGFLAILIGTGSKMLKTGTWKKYMAEGSGRDFALAALMGLLHFLAQNFYGLGALYLGRLGTTIGWALNIAASLLVANGFGFMIGEWKSARKSSVRTLYAGLLVLVVAMSLLAYGNSLVGH